MINQFDWYLMPADIQRMLPIIVNFAQQPVYIVCFGSAACDRDTFKYVRDEVCLDLRVSSNRI